MSLVAGTSRVEITPPIGSMMAGFPHRPSGEARRAEGVHDPLMARVLCLSDGETTIAWVAADVLFFDRVDVERIRRTVGKTIPDLSGPRLMFAANHTHSGFETCYLFGNTPDDPEVHRMNERIARAVVGAHADLRPVQLRGARVTAELAHNRRVRQPDGTWTMVFEYDPKLTTGVRDDDLPVLYFDLEDGGPLAMLYNFAAHALTIGPGNMLFTADFSGVSSAAIEAGHPGCTALFVNGAAGNQHPRMSMTRDFAVTEQMGKALAERVFFALDRAEYAEVASIEFVTDILRFPNRMSEENQVEVELSCVRLGPYIIAVVPGEPFIEFQLAFKQAVAPLHGLFIGYANGTCGYMPTRQACEEGGYGAAPCPGDPPGRERTALPPGAGEAILDRLIQMSVM
jgi:hypothetical protein